MRLAKFVWPIPQSGFVDASIFKVFVNIMFLKKMHLEKASWTELGSIWVAKRIQKGSQIGAKIDQQWYRKLIKK